MFKFFLGTILIFLGNISAVNLELFFKDLILLCDIKYFNRFLLTFRLAQVSKNVSIYQI